MIEPGTRPMSGASTSKAAPLPKLCLGPPALYLKPDGKGVVRRGAPSAASAAAVLAPGLAGGVEPHPLKLGKRARKRGRPDTAGAGWANMRSQELTPELKRELQMIRMRGALDPKRFYRTSDMKKELPKYFQMGTVVEGAGGGKTRPAAGGLFQATLNDQKIRARAKSQFRKVQQATMAGVRKTSGPKPTRGKAARR
jgi:hypothetical protein